MWLNPQETAELFTFTEENLLMENFIFCAVFLFNPLLSGVHYKVLKT